MTEITGLDRIPADMREAVGFYAARVWEQAGHRLKCLALYGPIASGRFDRSRHMVQNVAVMPVAELAALRVLAAEGHHFGRMRIAAPLVLTPEFVAGSLDTYPLELLEIQQQHVVILGEDLFAPLQFEPAHVRLQCERQLKVVALAMRQAALSVGMNWKSFQRAALPSVLDLTRVLRGLLWLKDRRQPLLADAMVREVESLIGQPLSGIRRVLESPETADWTEFEQLYAELEVLGRLADAS
jgi:hypothetical protein